MKRQASPESPSTEKQCKKEVLCCCLVRCGKPIQDSEQRVHLCCGPVKRPLKDAVINWNRDTGKALLHGACWRLLQEEADKRQQYTLEPSPQEKRLIKVAAKTAEFHDPEKGSSVLSSTTFVS